MNLKHDGDPFPLFLIRPTMLASVGKLTFLSSYLMANLSRVREGRPGRS